MALYLVSYDLDKPGQDYPDLISRLQQLGARRILYSEWFLISNASAVAVRDDLLRYMDANDRILICELKNHAAWQQMMISDADTLQFFRSAT